jgi:hypothetical protein
MARASWLARGSALVVAVSFAGACEQLIGVPTEPADVTDAVGRICDCTVLTDQGLPFQTSCEAGLAGLGDQELVDAAEAGCTRCPDGADELELLHGCYGRLTGAAAAGEDCSKNLECQSFACCATDVLPALNANGVTATHTDACCAVGQTCEGCRSIMARDDLSTTSNPDLVACAESIDIFLGALACGCQKHKAATGTDKKCAAQCGLLKQCDSLSLECRNCLIAEYSGVCEELEACQDDVDRPVQAQGTP